MTHQQAAWRSVFAPKDRRPIYEWAADNVTLSPPLTKTGPFDVSCSRHFVAIFDALADDSRREVNVLKPVRGGGTLIGDIFVPWTRTVDPGPTLFLLQTDKIADDHHSKVLLPTLESVPAIRNMLDALDRDQKQGRKIEFADGNHVHISGPSLGNLQTIGFRYVIEDECWMYDAGKIGEADGRVGDFLRMATSKILRISQGGPREGANLGEDDWHRIVNESELREWEIECPACHAYQLASMNGQRPDGTFWGLTWDKHKRTNGDWDVSKCIPTVRFECAACGHPVLDGSRTKSEWNRTGRYRIMTGENRKKVTFHWEAIIDFPWDELTELWLNACNAAHHGDPAPKLQFLRKRRAQFADLETLMRGGMTLTRTTYEINSTWPEEKARFMSVDRQEEDVFWWTVRAWSAEKSRRLAFGKAFGFAELEKLREQYKVQPNRTFCDSGYLPKGDHGVYSACARFGWIAVKGDKAYSFTHRITTAKGPRGVQRSYAPLTYGDPGYGITGGAKVCRLIRFSKPQFNAKVQELLDAGNWEEPATGDPEQEKEYSGQMASRFRKTFYSEKTGQSETIWYEGKDDHARDLANMQCLGAVLAKLLRDPAAEVLSKSESKE